METVRIEVRLLSEKTHTWDATPEAAEAFVAAVDLGSDRHGRRLVEVPAGYRQGRVFLRLSSVVWVEVSRDAEEA